MTLYHLRWKIKQIYKSLTTTWFTIYVYCWHYIPDSKVHGTNMGPIWGRQDPGGPHVSPINFAIYELAWVCPRYITATSENLRSASIARPRRHTIYMMTSSNGNIFRVTGPLCGEFTGHRWIPLTKVSDAELWCFLWSVPEQTVELTWDAIALIMTST